MRPWTSAIPTWVAAPCTTTIACRSRRSHAERLALVSGTRPALRRPELATDPAVHVWRDRDAGARHRCERRDLQRRSRRAPATAALRAAGASVLDLVESARSRSNALQR